MKIDYAIMGSNQDPMYLDFWPIISKTWKEVFNITPVLGFICDEDSDFIQSEYGLVKKFKAIEGINSGLQSQIVRHFLPKELNGNIITSDIDMVPLSKQYFIDDVASFDENKFYVMSSDNPECNASNEYPMCYNLANAKKFNEVLSVNKNWIEFAHELNSLKLGWTTDQKYLRLRVQEHLSKKPNEIVFLNRGWSAKGADKRVDRAWWDYKAKLVRSGHYIDSHLLRPYAENKEEVDSLINLLYLHNRNHNKTGLRFKEFFLKLIG